MVGNVDAGAVEKHKRLWAFDAKDHDLLVSVLSRFEKIVCTPNVLTEVSNLLRQSSEPLRSRFVAALSLLVGEIDERYVASAFAASSPIYTRLGLTDSGLLALRSHEFHLLTVDFDLYDAAARSKFPAINFTHLQAAAFDL